MENLTEITQQSLDTASSAKEQSKRVGLTFRQSLVICTIFCIVMIIIFGWKQEFTIEQPIESGIFGALGDFVGGFLGTIVALYTVYLLVRTLQNQIETNENVVSTNKSVIEANTSVIETNQKLVSQTALQIFDSRFSTLLNLYKDAISAYEDVSNRTNGRTVFENIVKEFKEKGLDNKTEYKRRSKCAIAEYVDLYVTNKQFFSVHFRMLYLLAKLTAEEKIHENFRVSYAKSIRGQLSENELLIIRYNCLSQYGEKMRIYVNKFNFIKHISIMSLLEFTRWRNLVNNNKYCSSIDQLYIMLKKIMTTMLDKEGVNNQHYIVSPRLVFDIELNENHDTFIVKLTLNKVKKKGGAIPRPIEEYAFDSLPLHELSNFLQELLTEMFLYSNFFQYNGDDNHIVSSYDRYDDDKIKVVEVIVSRPNKQLALADSQVIPS